MLCLFLLFVLFVALPFDEVSEGPRRGTQAIVAGLALGSAAISVAFARRGLRAHGAGEDA
jgi:F0F1-type ATP synthase membrane subunit c/vacuolar-type H+-ATPase subunit K